MEEAFFFSSVRIGLSFIQCVLQRSVDMSSTKGKGVIHAGYPRVVEVRKDLWRSCPATCSMCNSVTLRTGVLMENED